MNRLTKPTVLVLCICFFSTSGIAQVNSIKEKKSIEIGINLIQFSDFTRFSVYGESFSGILMPQLGIQLKQNVNQNSARRLSLNYYQTEVHKKEGGPSHTFGSEINAYDKGINVNVGMERLISKGTITSYLFIDLYQSFGTRTRDGFYYGCWSSGSYDEQHNYYKVGLAPGLGIDISLSRKLSVNLETNSRFIKEFKKANNNDHWNPPHKITINPISRLSFNYRL